MELGRLSTNTTTMSTDEPVPNAIRNFGKPFHAADADIIFRSSDNVDFRAHRTILIHASPFFASMFALPAPVAGTAGDDRKDGLTVVSMTEDEVTLRHLLCLCYTALLPSLDTMDELSLTIRLTHKFELGGATAIAKYRLLALAVSDPVRAYALGWILQSKEVVHAAAKESLAKPLLDISAQPEYEHIPASAILQLLAYHHRCLRAVPNGSSLLAWAPADSLPAAMLHPHGGNNVNNAGRCSCSSYTSATFSGGSRNIKHWPLAYLGLAVSDLQRNVRGSTVKRFSTLQTTVTSTYLFNCSNCRAAASAAIETLSESLATHVEGVITEALDGLQTPF
ncbi:unnamed protein product [Peniophora sp. CBMAI 1063]|nr:unnamed protein product [Peniophora sp. CBMAI 1063]